MSDFPIFEASQRQSKYPWAELEVGKSFAVPFDMVREPSLRVLANATGKKLGRKFFVRKHKESGVYEVGRSE